MNANKSFKKIHSAFRWNGEQYTTAKLTRLAKEYKISPHTYLQDIGQFFIDWFDDTPLIKVHTSGSTGAPKAMMVKKQYMVNSALATGKYFELPSGTTALLCLPATYIAGKLMLVRALVLGWKLDSVKPQKDPLKNKTKTYDFCAVTPYQLEQSLDKLHLVKKIMVGGGAVSKSLFERLQRHDTKVYETYAMTETLTHIAARLINAKPQPKNKPPFTLLDNVSISQDKRNCLVIKAPKVSDQTIITNDLVAIESPKTFRLKGRYDNIINSGGIKLIPEEIEQKLEALINARFFVTGLADDSLGEKLVLFIEDNFDQKNLNALQSAIKQLETLHRYERPKELFFVKPFIETHTGKINRLKTTKAKLNQA